MGRLVPAGASLPALLATAALAATVANLINNLPAVLVLLPLAAPSGAGAILAVLIGVNIGPNLSYTSPVARQPAGRCHLQRETVGVSTRACLMSTPASSWACLFRGLRA